MSDYKYKFSVISAVYNVEMFLREAVESVINQTIGFENIQLILVDDGTPDNSGKICDEYAAKYPENIFVIHKQNGGVSSARNTALEHIKGKYVNFMDSDDKWAPDALLKAWNFFEKHYEKTDVVALPIKFFDGEKGDHLLNYKFKMGSRIVDLKTDWDTIQMHVASSFFKSELFKTIRFDENLAYAEDAKVVQEAIFGKLTLGLLNKSAYLYRKRSTGAASAIQSSGQKPNWYLPVVKHYHMDIVQKSLDYFGELPKYVQMTLMYDLQWRISQRNFTKIDVLTDEEKQEYLSLLNKVMGYIEEDVILCQKNLNREKRLVALEMKYSSLPEVLVEEKDVFCAFSEEAKFSMANSSVHLEFLELKNSVAKIEGYLEIYNVLFEQFELSFWVNDEKVEMTEIPRESDLIYLNRSIVKRIGFKVEVKLDPSVKLYRLRLGALINNKFIFFQKYNYGYFFPITSNYRFSHYTKGDWTATAAKNFVAIKHSAVAKNKLTEFKFLLWIFKNNKNQSRFQSFLRLWYFIAKRFYKKPIWLISDRPAVAGDNGEAFFRYMVENHPEINAVFVINRKTADYKRLKEIGPVIKRLGLKHKLYLLLSEYIFSSHAENEQFDPFGKHRNVFRDIVANKRFVFLQHGITMNDLSGWLFRQNKNIFGFVTSAEKEYNSFLTYGYDYKPENIWLTGFPRFDRLYDESQKTISILPTWRKYLTNGNDPITREWNLIEDFNESEYFVFYNSLINHPRLLEAAKKYGYKINFALHPNLRAGAGLFNTNECVSITTEALDYNRVFATSDLIVTDYSSTVFDFVYLRKPVVYTQFDYKDFFGGSHSVDKGYFDFETDGFGEVEYDLDLAVNRIAQYMENNCQLKEKYRKRIDEFFSFDDKNNSKRVYEKAVKLREL